MSGHARPSSSPRRNAPLLPPHRRVASGNFLRGCWALLTEPSTPGLYELHRHPWGPVLISLVAGHGPSASPGSSTQAWGKPCEDLLAVWG